MVVWKDVILYPLNNSEPLRVVTSKADFIGRAVFFVEWGVLQDRTELYTRSSVEKMLKKMLTLEVE